ncbi:spore germination protein [Bacillus thermotolerans]|uniref:Spore germination protein n=1 Tax=Bacillus thermotolerans TaxID=1221996 RepID=A0A0F5I964_BACTR|nr:spore germination protein [Bacillus thermotolerans]KKB33197.1 Spore germination protein [Bacillus thermotolerans]KKB41850.1 Spore germination protein [Bacillus thermotolerans]
MKKERFKKGWRSPSKSELAALLEKCSESSDFVTFKFHEQSPFAISYYQTLVDKKVLQTSVLDTLKEKEKEWSTVEEIKEAVPIENMTITSQISDIRDKLMSGHILIYKEEDPSECLLISAANVQARQISVPETEYTVVGPKESFVESIETNVTLVRKRLPTPDFKTKELTVGNVTKTRVMVVYIDGIVSQENVNTVIQRIDDITYDKIVDASFINQMIADNPSSPFPQMVDTERPDRVASDLSEGKVAILVDGSPSALTGPTTLTEFFTAFEDYFTIWEMATVFRLIRLFAIVFSVLSTPLYVAVLTYHYEVVPQDVLTSLFASRAGIPFPPLMEAIILELTIELLREAGARLPIKVGQTIGIVGGIVIGTAAVQAGVTSNILLIIVALAALASFTTPVYQISNAVRLIRFPFLIGAGLLGFFGIAICSAILLAHLLKIKSLGRPYLAPVYPVRLKDLKDAFIRLPFDKQITRPMELRPEQPFKFRPKPKPNTKNDLDIDE